MEYKLSWVLALKCLRSSAMEGLLLEQRLQNLQKYECLGELRERERKEKHQLSPSDGFSGMGLNVYT